MRYRDKCPKGHDNSQPGQRGKDGHCKTCKLGWSRGDGPVKHRKAHYQENRESIAARVKAYYESHREERLAYHRLHYQRTKETQYAKQLARRAKNREAYLTYQVRYKMTANGAKSLFYGHLREKAKEHQSIAAEKGLSQ